MPVGLLTLELHIPDAQSLKDKRQVLRSLKDKLRRDFNVAVAELEHHDTWQRSVVGIVTISNEEKHLREVLQKVGRGGPHPRLIFNQSSGRDCLRRKQVGCLAWNRRRTPDREQWTEFVSSPAESVPICWLQK